MHSKLIYTTAENYKEAEYIAKTLIEKELAACVNIHGEINSFYSWKGKLESSKEICLIIKTTSENEQAIINQIKLIHSYEVPCIISLDIASGNSDFLEWIKNTVKS